LKISARINQRDDYQIEKAKIAIASGRFMDLVLGKCRRTFAAILV
jgi:hypothetical protein